MLNAVMEYAGAYSKEKMEGLIMKMESD